jgi:hypothetical protein
LILTSNEMLMGFIDIKCFFFTENLDKCRCNIISKVSKISRKPVGFSVYFNFLRLYDGHTVTVDRRSHIYIIVKYLSYNTRVSIIRSTGETLIFFFYTNLSKTNVYIYEIIDIVGRFKFWSVSFSSFSLRFYATRATATWRQNCFSSHPSTSTFHGPITWIFEVSLAILTSRLIYYCCYQRSHQKMNSGVFSYCLHLRLKLGEISAIQLSLSSANFSPFEFN